MSGDAISSLTIEALTAAAFAPFGDVIAASAATRVFPINDGTAQRFHALGKVDCAAQDGHALISLVRATPRAMPFTIHQLERHPLGSQAFVPLAALRYLVVVAAGPEQRPRAFLASEGQGVNFHRGTWHHPLLALETISDFLVIDRGGEGQNCEVARLPVSYLLEPEQPDLGYCD